MNIITLENISKKFCKKLHLSLWYGFVDLFVWRYTNRLRKHESWAINDVSLTIKDKEFIGILGRNGSGKTTLVRTITGIYNKDAGKLSVNGKVIPLFVGNLALNKFYSGLDNFYFLGATLGYSKKQLKEKIQIVEDFSELGEDIYNPMGVYSMGMKIRLRFGCVKALNPELLIIDEALAVSDTYFQEKCYRFLVEFAKTNTVVLITHDLSVIEKYCNRIILMDKGSIKLDTNDVQHALTLYRNSEY